MGMGFDAAVHFSSETCEWYTPQDFFDKLNEEFGFDLDVCATAENAKCQKFFTKKDNGLSRKWTGMCWMNPPYGREIGKWVQKAYESSLWGDSGLLGSGQNRYEVVPGLLPAPRRGTVCTRQVEVWRVCELGSLSLCSSDFQTRLVG